MIYSQRKRKRQNHYESANQHCHSSFFSVSFFSAFIPPLLIYPSLHFNYAFYHQRSEGYSWDFAKRLFLLSPSYLLELYTKATIIYHAYFLSCYPHHSDYIITIIFQHVSTSCPTPLISIKEKHHNLKPFCCLLPYVIYLLMFNFQAASSILLARITPPREMYSLGIWSACQLYLSN